MSVASTPRAGSTTAAEPRPDRLVLLGALLELASREFASRGARRASD